VAQNAASVQQQMRGQHPLLTLKQWNLVNPIVAYVACKFC
jgi:hypothetical protein